MICHSATPMFKLASLDSNGYNANELLLSADEGATYLSSKGNNVYRA
jgi:hypothetical protein